MSSAPIRILIADDHAVLRAGLRMLLNSQNTMQVVGEAGDGQETIKMALELNPDLILLDLSMSKLGGMEVLPILRKTVSTTKVLVLTMHDDDSYLRQTLRDGAAGYVLKKAADSELLSAIHAVMRGEVYVHPSMTRVLLEDLLPAQLDNPSASPWDLLSEREQEVLTLVARGFTSSKIGEQLNLSPKTIETYRARGMEKLELRSRAALVQFFLTYNLFED